jgi:hypothetical protein
VGETEDAEGQLFSDEDAGMNLQTYHCPEGGTVTAGACAKIRQRPVEGPGLLRFKSCAFCPGIEALNAMTQEEEEMGKKVVGTCLWCEEEKWIQARGLCSTCYSKYNRGGIKQGALDAKRKEMEERNAGAAPETSTPPTPEEASGVAEENGAWMGQEVEVTEQVTETQESSENAVASASRVDTQAVTAAVMEFDLSEFEDVVPDSKFRRCTEPRLHVHRDRLYLNPNAQRLLNIDPGSRLLIKLHPSLNALLLKPVGDTQNAITVQHNGHIQCRSLHHKISHHVGRRFVLHQAQEGFFLATLEQAA